MIVVYGGNIQSAINAFRHETVKAGILAQIRERQKSWKPSERRKRKMRNADKRRKQRERRYAERIV